MRIVLATDGSPGAVGAAEFLACLRLTGEDEIRLVAVESTSVAAGKPDFFSAVRTALAASPVRLSEEVRTGAPADQLLTAAQEAGADLLVVGAMGATGLARYFVGSVAERVLRHADRSVLVARPVRHRLRRAIAGVDASSMAPTVVERLAALPLPDETEIDLVTVLPPQGAATSVAPMVWASLSSELERALREAREDAEERLRDLSRLVSEGSHPARAEIVCGEPEAGLLSVVDKEEVDLIAVGSHGEGGLDRFLLGAVSERVARHAPCSVLVVR